MTTNQIHLESDDLTFATTRTGNEIHVEFTLLAGKTYCGAKVYSRMDEREAPASRVCARCHRDGEARR